MKRKLRLLDASTDETFDAPIYLNIPRKRSSLYGDRWFQVSQDARLQIVADPELRGLATTVLLYIEGRLDFENYIHVPQQEIADRIGASRVRVTKAISKLVEKGILIKGPSIGRASSYRLNPAYGWKGDNKKAHEYQLELIKGGRE